MRAGLKDFPPGVPLMDAIRRAIIDFNYVPPEYVPQHRRRMELILGVPTLFAHSALRFTEWRQVVAEFAAERTGGRPDALAPQAIAHAVLGICLAAYEHWLNDESADIGDLLDEAMRKLGAAFEDDVQDGVQAGGRSRAAEALA
jgi:AcrR family transcriptional regulator